MKAANYQRLPFLKAVACAGLMSMVAVTLGAGQQDPERFTVNSSGRPVVVWSRRSKNPLGVVVLVHGRTWGARTAFDFDVGDLHRSLLKALEAAGFAAYAVDLPGYGESARDATGWLSPTRAALDVEAVLDFAAQRHPGLPAPVLLGWSRGSKISALVATRNNRALSGLILYAYTFDPAAPPLYGEPTGAAPAISNTAESAASDFISPDVAEPALVREFVKKALALDAVQATLCCDAEFQSIRPEAIHIPTLMIQGARDPGIKPQVAAHFFAQVAAGNKRWIVIAGGDHAAHLESTAAEVSGVMVQFARSAVGSPGTQ